MPRKVYVEVIAKTTVEGKLIPLSIKWEDGLVTKLTKFLILVKQALMLVALVFDTPVESILNRHICLRNTIGGLLKEDNLSFITFLIKI